VAAAGGLVLIDPLVDDWNALDRLVAGGGGCTGIVRTCNWHQRSIVDVASRYDVDIWARPHPADGVRDPVDHAISDRDEPFDGLRVIDVERADEIALWLPRQRALPGAGGMRRRPSGKVSPGPGSWGGRGQWTAGGTGGSRAGHKRRSARSGVMRQGNGAPGLWTRAVVAATSVGVLAAIVIGVIRLSAPPAAALASAAPTPAAAWATPNGDPFNRRVARSSISSANVKQLKRAWAIPITSSLAHSINPAGQFGSFASTPIIGPGGVGYFQDAANNVWAANIATGKILWRHDYNRPNEGPNGLTLEHGILYGTAATKAFALNAQTGHEMWHTGRLIDTAAQGRKALKIGAKEGVKQVKGVSPVGQGLNFAPQVSDGRVIVSTSGQPSGGALYALSARTGKTLWRLQEVVRPRDRPLGGAAGTAGAWNAPAIGPDGTIYLGLGNPYRDNDQGIHRATPLLYDNSVIAVNPATGKVKWHYQGVPNDFYDWDMQISPMFTTVHGRNVIIAGGKMGYVYELDAATGRLIFKTPVGKHNGHDNDSVLALHHKFHPKYPYRVFPGDLGGIETNAATDGNVAYVSTVNLYQTRPNPSAVLAGSQPFSQGSGDEVAINLATGKILWSTKLPSPPFGAATISNDLVFTTTYNGRVIAFSRTTGKIVWTGKLPSGTNSPLVIQGNTLVAVASLGASDSKPQVDAWQLPG
jgi:glucose dehydrogenase